jgi:hypothetical protein
MVRIEKMRIMKSKEQKSINKLLWLLLLWLLKKIKMLIIFHWQRVGWQPKEIQTIIKILIEELLSLIEESLPLTGHSISSTNNGNKHIYTLCVYGETYIIIHTYIHT